MEQLKEFLNNDKSVKNLVTIIVWFIAIITSLLPLIDGIF